MKELISVSVTKAPGFFPKLLELSLDQTIEEVGKLNSVEHYILSYKPRRGQEHGIIVGLRGRELGCEIKSLYERNPLSHVVIRAS